VIYLCCIIGREQGLSGAKVATPNALAMALPRIPALWGVVFLSLTMGYGTRAILVDRDRDAMFGRERKTRKRVSRS